MLRLVHRRGAGPARVGGEWLTLLHIASLPVVARASRRVLPRGCAGWLLHKVYTAVAGFGRGACRLPTPLHTGAAPRLSPANRAARSPGCSASLQYQPDTRLAGFGQGRVGSLKLSHTPYVPHRVRRHSGIPTL